MYICIYIRYIIFFIFNFKKRILTYIQEHFCFYFCFKNYLCFFFFGFKAFSQNKYAIKVIECINGTENKSPSALISFVIKIHFHLQKWCLSRMTMGCSPWLETKRIWDYSQQTGNGFCSKCLRRYRHRQSASVSTPASLNHRHGHYRNFSLPHRIFPF